MWSTEIINAPKRPGKASKTTTTTTTTSVTKGPFESDTARSFANTLPCREALLPISKFGWKLDKEPRAAPRKRIANYVGFEALIYAIKKKRVTENVVVWLHLPKPAKDDHVSY